MPLRGRSCPPSPPNTAARPCQLPSTGTHTHTVCVRVCVCVYPYRLDLGRPGLALLGISPYLAGQLGWMDVWTHTGLTQRHSTLKILFGVPVAEECEQCHVRSLSPMAMGCRCVCECVEADVSLCLVGWGAVEVHCASAVVSCVGPACV